MIGQGLHLTREQKVGAGFLLLFGVLTIGLGLLQMRNTIYGPFVLRATDSADTTALFVDEQTRLQQIDTDHDGLNDFEELQFYTTSPYLPDTDSDGVKDKVEIDRGTDPLCVEGQACEASETIPEEAKTPIETPLYDETGSVLDVLSSGTGASAPPDATGAAALNDLQALIQNPAALRQMLSATGKISIEELNAIPDATLIGLAAQLFQESAAESTAAPVNEP